MKKLSPKTVVAIALVTVFAVMLVGWFGFVSRQMSRATSLEEQIADARTELVTAKLAGRHKEVAQSPERKQQLLKVAMPDAVEMPAIMRQLLGAARTANVRVDGISTQAMTPMTGYDTVPVDLILTGSFPGVKRFLLKVRKFAGTDGDSVHAKGRLFSVDSVEFSPGENELPQLTATVRLKAFVYHFAPPSASPAPADGTVSTSAAPAEGTR
jgi:type IV pilus assembly PilO-like protein